ncbi:hypothetical protein [Luteimonas sp. 3794]|nr:hypothetical protein [Luteimonas sp. 3794]MDR6992934.1 GTPase involved in cell partitioning and DNA repair [Luteimonas sp. 3794]
MPQQTQNPQQSAQSQNTPGQQGGQGNDRQDDATRQAPQRQTPGGSEEEE